MATKEILKPLQEKYWPVISIVIPTFNQEQYIEATISSVLDQGYPKTELIIIDGGRTDGTLEVIKKYERYIAYWVSEPDNGQTHAINKGMAQATGEIRAYLNSDDIFLPGSLMAVADFHLENPDVDLIHGGCVIIDVAGETTGRRIGNISNTEEVLDLWGVWWQGRNFVQPEVFWTKRIAEKVGAFREDLHYVMDYEYWLRIFLASGKVGTLDRDLAAFRITPTQKSANSQAAADELRAVVEPFLWDPQVPLTRLQRLNLRARWLYDARFLVAVQEAVESGASRWGRYARLLSVLAAHPKLLVGPGIYNRTADVVRGKLGIS